MKELKSVGIHSLEYINFFTELIDAITNERSMEELSERFILIYEKDYDEEENALDILSPIESFTLYCLLAYEVSEPFCERVNSLSGGSALNLHIVKNLASYILDDYELDLGLLLDPDSFLNTYLINRKGELKGALSFKRGILPALLGEPYALGLASECVSFCSADQNEDNAIEDADKNVENMLSIMTIQRESGEPFAITLCGQEGTGRKHTAALCSAICGMDLLCVHADKILTHSEADSMEYMRRIITKCVLEDFFLYIEIPEKCHRDPIGLQRLISMSEDYLTFIFMGVTSPVNDMISLKGTSYIINVKNPNRKLQKSLWQYFADKLSVSFDEDVDLNHLVSTYDLTPGRIERTLKSALPLAVPAPGGFKVDNEILKTCIRSQCAVQFSQFVTRLDTQFTWEDVELTRENKEILTQAIDRVRLRATINDEYGFGRLLPYGKGVVIALFGPPGTGKTMTANVIANELGMDIYRIDLSQVGSKYIGETEKNIASIFETAKYSNGILFFDEADALFSKRTEVSSSNDRHANAETAFLLQKIEEYEGVSILATNIISNMDIAFRRRMTYIVNIHNPDEELRKKLWTNVFPKDAPLANGINIEKFAVLEFSGSNIKSAAVAASYIAAARDGIITEDDILNAVDMEFKKLGYTGSASAKVRGY